MTIIENLKSIGKLNLGIENFLTRKARWLIAVPDIKSYEYFLRTILHLVNSVYDGYIAGEFIDITASLIQGQLTRAYQEAVEEAGLDIDQMTPEMNGELEEIILNEFNYVDRFYRDIIDARINETSIQPLLARAELWANRFNDTKNKAALTIKAQFGGRLEWVLGATEEHCETCARLNRLVAFASEWRQSGIFPQNPPNPVLECGGWKCDCKLQDTERRRSPKVLETLMDIATARNI
jgi:hypothetical protein